MSGEIWGEPWPYVETRSRAARADTAEARVRDLEHLLLDWREAVDAPGDNFDRAWETRDALYAEAHAIAERRAGRNAT